MLNDKPRILVVDNAEADCAMLAERLVKYYHVDCVAGGQGGLERAETHPPDLILVETAMQGMDGFEVCRRLKENERTQGIPVIFMAHHSEELDEARGIELGAVDYITKPFRYPLVMARIKNNIELKRRGDLLEDLAMIDGMTKLPNRQSFEKAMTTEWFRGQRSQEALSLILGNLDEFRKYNDHFGHAMGDALVYNIGRSLKKTASRASDVTARIGWEGFAIILPATEREGAMTLAESIRQTIESQNIPHAPSATREYVTISLGVATMTPSRESTPEFLLEEASKALKEAKESGRNQAVLAAEYVKLFG